MRKNKEDNAEIQDKREEERCETDDEKIAFMRRFGWIKDDDDAKSHSEKYKETV